jgi:sterol desaturase/sphingolipid hydroxylase (fatty acid hydroxylase superfamily)
VSKNFGVVLSAWDWLFGTAYWPRERAPARLGYPGDGELPRDLPRQMLFPLTRSGQGGEGLPQTPPA